MEAKGCEKELHEYDLFCTFLAIYSLNKYSWIAYYVFGD